MAPAPEVMFTGETPWSNESMAPHITPHI